MPMEIPWASVVIPTYGEKGVGLTDTCIRTLRETHAHMLPEITIVSDGDEEEVMGKLAELAERYEVNLLRIDRRGFAAACNAGIKASDGEIGVFLVNNDIEFIEPCLQVMGDAMRATKSGIIGCLLLYPDRTVQHGGVTFVPNDKEEGLPGYFDHICRGYPENHPNVVNMRPSLVTGALLGINRDFIAKSGLLDERFGFTAEDIDLCLRAFECGMSSTYIGYTKAVHHEGASRGKTLEEKMALYPEIAKKELASLEHLFRKWVGTEFRAYSLHGGL